jgi:ketosteroid isomerase-like protein
MATTHTTSSFDSAALKRAIEERDASGQLAVYADDARIEVVDKENPPSRPLVFSGREAIREYLEDLTSRDMSHSVSALVVDGEHGAATVDCAYPAGTKVLCMCTMELRDGQIASQRGVQAWDE